MEVSQQLPNEADIDPENILSVSELNQTVKTTVEDSLSLDDSYIAGDVSDLGVSNGNVHFDLVHDGASIHCVVFERNRSQLAISPEQDMQVAVYGDLSFYKPEGHCSLLVNECVDLGESGYSKIYRENKQKLSEDGLLSDDVKQPLPDIPQHIGIVTSADSSARADVVNAIHNRFPPVDITISDVSVQGGDALHDLLNAVTSLDKDATVDLVLVTRGGGADKQLRVFNETPVCRVIANAETPVVVAVGHEDDQTLAGEVADQRVMTPTDAGEIVPDQEVEMNRINEYEDRLTTAYKNTINNRIEHYESRLSQLYQSTATESISQIQHELASVSDKYISSRLNTYNQTLTSAVESYFLEYRHTIAQLDSQLHSSYQSYVSGELQLLSNELQTKSEAVIAAKIDSFAQTIETAYEKVEQRTRHEEELEETVDAVRKETQREYQALNRKYKMAIAALILLLLLLILSTATGVI